MPEPKRFEFIRTERYDLAETALQKAFSPGFQMWFCLNLQ